MVNPPVNSLHELKSQFKRANIVDNIEIVLVEIVEISRFQIKSGDPILTIKGPHRS
ncbi:hypothetical protein D3C87_1835490 [compost metagenome]